MERLFQSGPLPRTPPHFWTWTFEVLVIEEVEAFSED